MCVGHDGGDSARIDGNGARTDGDGGTQVERIELTILNTFQGL